jgi:hypothetical protein
VTIFYPYPDGEKMTEFDKTYGYNIVILYEKREGNTGRVLDQPKRTKLHKIFQSEALQSIKFRIFICDKIGNFASFYEISVKLVKRKKRLIPSGKHTLPYL